MDVGPVDRRATLQPYWRVVLLLLLRRLSESRTPKLSRAFAKLLFTYIARTPGGAVALFELFGTVQPGYVASARGVSVRLIRLTLLGDRYNARRACPCPPTQALPKRVPVGGAPRDRQDHEPHGPQNHNRGPRLVGVQLPAASGRLAAPGVRVKAAKGKGAGCDPNPSRRVCVWGAAPSTALRCWAPWPPSS